VLQSNCLRWWRSPVRRAFGPGGRRRCVLPAVEALEDRLALTPFSFLVQGFPSPVLAGAQGGFTVTAITKGEGGGDITDESYNGIVSFSSNDLTAQLPQPTALEAGTGNFTAAFPSGGVKSITVTDPQLGVTGSQTGIQVTPILTPVGVSFVAVQGAAAPADGVVAQFTSLFADPPGAYKASIDWGDGTVTPGSVTADSAGGYLVNGTHSYQPETDFTVDVTISDPGRNTSEVAAGGAAVLSASEAALLLDFGFARNSPGDSILVASSTGIDAVLNQPLPVTGPVTLFVATYAANPTGVPSDGLVYYDVRVTGTDGRAVLTVNFAYPAAFTGRGTLYFFDSVTQTFRPVAGSTRVPDSLVVNPAVPVITLITDNTGVPRLADLTQTVFTIRVATAPTTVTTPVSAPVAVTSNLDPVTGSSTGRLDPPSRVTATDAGVPQGVLSNASFSRSNQVTLTLIPLQQSEVRTTQAALATPPLLDQQGSDRVYGLPDSEWLRLLWALWRLLLRHDGRWVAAWLRR
jgi:hypothetical protein